MFLLRTLAVAACLCLVPELAVAGESESPVGTWKTIDDDTGKPRSLVTIWTAQGKLYGKIDKLFPAPGDVEDPRCTECEGALKDKAIVGLRFLWDLEFDDGEWTDGYILDPATGTEYKCTVVLAGGGKKLKVRGYVGFSLIGRTQTWLRL